MPFLRSLIGQAVRKVASDPRVREAAKQLFEDDVKPLAKPGVAVAKDKAIKGAARLAARVKKEFDDGKSG